MELFENIRTESFIILVFYICLRLCKYKNIVFSFRKENKTDIVLIFSIFIIFEAAVMILSGNVNSYFPSGIFIIVSGYFSGVLYGIITLLVSSFIITSFSINSGIKILISLVAASSACSMLYKKAGSRFSTLLKIFTCCFLSALIKFLSFLILFNFELPELASVFITDSIGSVIVIYIIEEYICLNRNEDENIRNLAKLRIMNYRNLKLKNIIEAEDKSYIKRYKIGFIINALDKLMELCRKDTYKAREMIENMKIYIDKPDEFLTGMIKLDKELKLISAYIKIIQMEYDEKININLKIKGDISKYFLPARIIEPVIENSILHGIYPKASGGEVFIEIEASGGKININIKDTGIGIDSETVENIFKNNNKSLGKIYRRLKHIYKNNFKMEIKSRIEDGTNVLIELPQTRFYLLKNAAG